MQGKHQPELWLRPAFGNLRISTLPPPLRTPYQHTHSKQWLAAPDLFTRVRQTLSRQPARTGATGTLPRTKGLPKSSP